MPLIRTSGLNFRMARGDIAAEGEAVLDDAVGVIEELHRVDSDDACAVYLLLHSEPAGLVGVHPIDARLPFGNHEIADFLALRGQRAMALAAPYSRSSGWAATARARDQFSGRGKSLAGCSGMVRGIVSQWVGVG